MKIFKLKTLSASIVLIAMLSGCKANQAPDAATPATPAATADVPVAAPAEPVIEPAAEATQATKIPETADAIWTAINQTSAELKTSIDSGNLKNVHHQAFAIRDLVAALPSHSPTLAAKDQTKLENEVKFVTTLADRLDETGDAKDKAGTQENYDKLVTVLNGITRTK